MTDAETEVRADVSVEPHRKRCFPAQTGRRPPVQRLALPGRGRERSCRHRLANEPVEENATTPSVPYRVSLREGARQCYAGRPEYVPVRPKASLLLKAPVS